MNWPIIAICFVVYLGLAFFCSAWVAAKDADLGWLWVLGMGCGILPLVILFVLTLGLLTLAGKIWVVWWLLSLMSGIPGPNEVLL